MRSTHRIRLLAGATALALLAGCGSSGHASSSTGTDNAVRKAMNTWFASATPSQACAGMTAAFRMFIGDGDPSKCAADISSKIALPNAGGRHFHATITKITYMHGFADVRATFAGDANNYYFAKDRGVWKLNSIGTLPTGGPSAPPPSSRVS